MPELVTWAQRPELAGLGPDSGEIWPEYNLHGDVFDDWWEPLLRELPQYQFALLDDETGEVLAEGHTAPVAWSGEDADLPDGIDAALVAAVSGARTNLAAANTLCAMAAEVPPGGRRRGLAAALLGGMREIAQREGLTHLVAPVRPSWKDRYPLTPIERYVTWRLQDGKLLDPWMRLHERLGARVSTPLPHSMRISGTVADWEAWTGLVFPDSGAYVFPQGLAPVKIDLGAGTGSYWEPNVWVVHPDVV